MLSPHLRWVSSLDQRKCGIGWATAHYKVFRWLLSLANGVQLVITYLCVDKLSELQISLAGELSSVITLILIPDVRGIHIQLKPLKLIPVMDAWLDKVVHQEIVFKGRLSSIHLQCKHMIYLLTLFWNNFLNLTFFLVIKQIANCRSYWVTNNRQYWFNVDS